MSVVNNADDLFHKIRVKLYRNYLPSLKGSYVARTKYEARRTCEPKVRYCAAYRFGCLNFFHS